MKFITIYRQIPGSSLSIADFDRIDALSDNAFAFGIVDELDILTNKHGWYFTETTDNGRYANVFLSLPADASMSEVLQVIAEIKAYSLNPDGSGPGSSLQKSRKEDFLIDLGAKNGGNYEGLFPLITIANAPKWLTDLLNTLTGHGKLSLYLWMAITGIVASKMALQKKRTMICWLVLSFSAKMTYDAYRYRQNINNQNEIDDK